MEEQITVLTEILQESIKELHLLQLRSNGKSALAGMKGKRNWDNFKT